MESIYTELALYESKNWCSRTDNVLFLISEFCDGTVSLVKKNITKNIKYKNTENNKITQIKNTLNTKYRKYKDEYNHIICYFCHPTYHNNLITENKQYREYKIQKIHQ